MSFWLKLFGGLFAYKLAKKHIATKKDLEKLSQELGQDKASPFPQPSHVDIQYRKGRYGSWTTSTGQVPNDPQLYRPTMESLANNDFGKYGVRAVDQNGQIVDMIPGSE